MPAPEKAFLKQRAVLLPFTGYDRYGKPAMGEPEEIRVRWVTRRTQSIDAMGSPIALDATVITKQVIALGSQMWLGRLEDWYGTGTGTAVEDIELMRVATFSDTPDLKGRVRRYRAGLQRERANSSDGS